MPNPIPGKFTLDDDGNRVQVFAEEKAPAPKAKAAPIDPAPADSPAVDPEKPAAKPKKRSAE